AAGGLRARASRARQARALHLRRRADRREHRRRAASGRLASPRRPRAHRDARARLRDAQLLRRGDGVTAIRLALGGAERTWSAGLAERRGWRIEDKPSMLISYHYRQFIECMQRIDYRDWVLDSGAFSAAFAGAHIDLDEYI